MTRPRRSLFVTFVSALNLNMLKAMSGTHVRNVPKLMETFVNLTLTSFIHKAEQDLDENHRNFRA